MGYDTSKQQKLIFIVLHSGDPKANCHWARAWGTLLAFLGWMEPYVLPCSLQPAQDIFGPCPCVQSPQLTRWAAHTVVLGTEVLGSDCVLVGLCGEP